MRKIIFKTSSKVNKKGFTLVELIVCIAIVAVISMLLASFVASTTNAYRRTYSTTMVQEKSQDVLNKVANIVRNSTSLKVTKNSVDKSIVFESKGYKIKNDENEYESQTILLVYIPSDDKENHYGKIYVDYDYYDTDAKDEDAEGDDDGANLKDITKVPDKKRFSEYLLTDMVKDFKVDFSTYQSLDENGDEYTVLQKRTLDLSITLERNDRVYTHSIKASLRNSSPEGMTSELTIQMEEI